MSTATSSSSPININTYEHRGLLREIHDMVRSPLSEDQDQVIIANPPQVSFRHVDVHKKNILIKYFPDHPTILALMDAAGESPKLEIQVKETTASVNINIDSNDTLRPLDVSSGNGAVFEGNEHCDRTYSMEQKKAAASSPRFMYEITLYIQMYLCEQQTLGKWIYERNAAKKAISDQDNLQIFKQIVSGVDHIHVNGIVHRDLKPCNIFLGLDGCWKVGDFGLSKILGSGIPESKEKSKTNTIIKQSDCHTTGIGTAAYASPEQVNGKIYDKQVDLYSLGVILLELYSSFGTAMERAYVLQNIRHVPPCIPEQLCTRYPKISEIIRQLLNPRPEARPTTQELLKHEIFHPEMTRLQDKVKEQELIIKSLRADIQRLGLKNQ